VVPVAARVWGVVLHARFRDNQRVKQGEVIVELDPADYAARVQQAEAELAAAQAQVQVAEAQVRVVQMTTSGALSSAQAQLSGSVSSVAGAGAQVDAAQATLARARIEQRRTAADLVRAQELRAQGVVPQSQVDNAQAAADGARSAVALAEAQLAAAREQTRTAETHVAEAQGRVDQSTPVDAQIAAAGAAADLARARVAGAQAALDLARLQLSYTTVAAPVDGVLSKLAVREGQLVQPGQTLVAIVPTATYVVANFKETQVGRMRQGQRAEIEVDAYPGQTFAGRIDSISAATGARFSLLPPDNASGNFVKVVQRVPVQIVWVDLPAGVAPQAGLSAEVTVWVE